MSTNLDERERDKFGFIGLAPRPSKKPTTKKCLSITYNLVNHDSLPREPLNLVHEYPRGYFFTWYRYILCAIHVPGTYISVTNYLPLIFSTKEVLILPLPIIVIRTTIFMNAILKAGKPLARISTLHSKKAFSFI